MHEHTALIRVRYVRRIINTASAPGRDGGIATATVQVPVFGPVEAAGTGACATMGDLLHRAKALLVDVGGRWLTVAPTWTNALLVQGARPGEETVIRYTLMSVARLSMLIAPECRPDYVRAVFTLFAADVSDRDIQAMPFGLAQACQASQAFQTFQKVEPGQVARTA